jgi:putative transposase
MPNYRRAHVPSATYFLTVNLTDRSSDLLVRKIDVLRTAFAKVVNELPFETNAMVVLPDHLHALWTLPEGDSNYSERVRRLKAYFSAQITKHEPVKASLARKGERGIWQRRFWEHLIRDEADYVRHIDYIHINPLKHGHVKQVKDWPYSTFHRYVKNGDLPADWGGVADSEMDFGEQR